MKNIIYIFIYLIMYHLLIYYSPKNGDTIKTILVLKSKYIGLIGRFSLISGGNWFILLLFFVGQ